MTTRVVECTNLPLCEPNDSDASSLHMDRIGYVAYDTDDDGVALVRFDGCVQILSGPNDEAFHHHRYYSLGLKHYTIQEIVGSPWIAELSAILDRDGSVERLPGVRHFVLALKEGSVDVAAESARSVGVFDSHQEAMRAAIALAR
jgi:hypothetical protein